MSEASDLELVREYAAHNSEPAFAELVQRHIPLVYSVALRYTGNSHDAEDVTQAVFIILARKAAGLRDKTVLTGWLYETARFAGMQFSRTNIRRQIREQEAHVQSTVNDPKPDDAWRQIAPLLEEAMTRLGEKDRTLLALRFFENRDVTETAALMGIGEWAARKRTERAVDKLRIFFARRGVRTTTAVLIGTISANSLQAAPAALANSVAAVAIAKGAAAGGSTLTLIQGALKLMAWTKAKTAVITGACVLVAAGTTTLTVCLTEKKPELIQGIPGDWSMLSGNADQWDSSNDVITGHTTNGDSILASTRKYDNVTVSAMVSTTNREASLALRMQDADNGYLAAFVPDGTPAAREGTSKITLLKRTSGEERELALFIRRGLSGPGRQEKFTFRAKGSRLEILLNDVTVLKTNDTAFTSGYVGLRVYGDPKIPCDGTFSNLTVR